MGMHLVTRQGTQPTALEAMRMGAQGDPVMEYQRLAIVLKAATEEEAMSTIAFMFKCLPMENAGDTDEEKAENAEIMTAAYKLAVQGYPKWAIREARDAFIAGRVEGYTSEFVPRPPVFGRELSRRCDEMQAKMIRMRRQADENVQFRGPRTGPRPPELKALGDRRVAELRAAAAEDRQRWFGKRSSGAAEANPITAEMMKDVPDAPKRGLPAGMQQMPVPDEFKNLKPGR